MHLRAGYVAMRAYNRARLLRARVVPARPWQGVRILGYHSISRRDHPLCVAPEAFRAQIEQLAASGATPLRLEDAIELLARPVEGRFVCVTFDDGYLDNAEAAEPVLAEHGVPATVFVTTGVLDGKATFHWFDRPPPALSWQDARDLERGGLVDVQPHTRTHPWLPRLGEAEARGEIEGSKQDVEQRLGKRADVFCYPAGLYGERDVRLVEEAGFRAAVTTEPGLNGGGGPLTTLRRTLVYGGDGEFAFGAKLAGKLDAPPALRGLLYRRRSTA